MNSTSILFPIFFIMGITMFVKCTVHDLRKVTRECLNVTIHERWSTFDDLYCPDLSSSIVPNTNAFCNTRGVEERICACWGIPEWKLNDSEIISLQSRQLSEDTYNEHQNSSLSLTYYKLQLPYGNLSHLPERLCNVNTVIEIDVSFNYFESISDFNKGNCFTNLDTLNISYNLIQVVERNALTNLVRLRNLDISHNKIHTIEPYALFTGKFSQIMWADFSHNNLSEIDLANILLVSSYCSLSYSNNYISKFTNKLQFALPAYIYETVNSVGYLDLSYNNIEYIPDARLFRLSSMTDIGSILFTRHAFQLENNPLVCDCNVMDLIKTASIAVRVYKNGGIDYGLRCHSPQNMRDVMFNEYALNDKTLDRFICNFTSCPMSCECFYRPAKMKVVLRCTEGGLLEMKDLNLKELPDKLVYSEVKLKYEESKIEVNFQHNSISHLSSVSYLGKISLLNLSFNNLKDIDADILKKIPKNAVIDLRSNPMLRKLPKEIATFEFSNVNISFLTLDCTCDDEMYTWLPDWIKASDQLKQIDVFCVINDEKVPASDISGELLGCTNFTLLYVLSVVSLILLILGGLAIYFRYEIYFLYRQRRQRDNSNRKSKYHLYVAYDDQNINLTTWIIEKFSPDIERKGYVMFLPSRDTRPGESKEEEIRGAIQASQNVVFFLTENFVSGKDLWMMIEYRAAWNYFKEDISRRIILVNFQHIQRRSIQINSLRAIYNVGIVIPFHDDVITQVFRILEPQKDHDDFHMI